MIEKILDMIKSHAETYREMLLILGKSNEFHQGFFAAIECATKVIVDASDNGLLDDDNLNCCSCNEYLDKGQAYCRQCAKHLIDI